MKQRDVMENGNLSWCKPVELTYRGKSAIIAQNEGNVVGLLINGKDAPVADFNSLVDHLGITGADELSDLYNYTWDGEEVTAVEMGCRNCPWFNTCEAMDTELGE